MFFSCFSVQMAQAESEKQARWIYYPGDLEIYLHSRLHTQRTERNQDYPPIWRLDTPYSVIDFRKIYTLDEPVIASLVVDGKYFVELDGQILYDFDPQAIELPAGRHQLNVRVMNMNRVPSIRFECPAFTSDDSWLAIYDGRAVQAACYRSAVADEPPASFKLAVTPIAPVSQIREAGYQLYAFGKNTFGFPIFEGIEGTGELAVYYGESREEAMSEKLAETWDIRKYDAADNLNDTLPTKAFRYVKVVPSGTVDYQGLSALYEYLPVNYRGAFSCSDSLLNAIYETALYTFHLNTRECHLDGIKRDRWVWSGDALQSYWMNFYSFFDEDVNKRTLWGLRGHSPVNRHINTILDYTFYWLIGIESHYQYTGDSLFIRQIYPQMLETMAFADQRLTADGLVAGQPGDWVFVDWAPISKEGVLSLEQLLYVKSLQSLAVCAAVAGDEAMAAIMQKRYENEAERFGQLFWSDDKQAFMHRINPEGSVEELTRYANMFAILFDQVDEAKKQQIKANVLLNPDILQITTPYMKFYELAALCEIGEHQTVLDYVRSYWGDMLNLGATTFWEAYDPTAPADGHYEMYGRPFGKSLCHAWGANPVYLFGKYFLGVTPASAGYETYRVQPQLGGLEWMEGCVPTPKGDIALQVSPQQIRITTAGGGTGELIINSSIRPQCETALIEQSDPGQYRILLDKPDFTYVIQYQDI